MKLLHTSDWHLGHTLYNFDRTLEQTAMIEQMVEFAKVHKPDVFLISGDVYHTGQPSAAVQKLFTEAMLKIHNTNPEMTIVVTAGNHDSASKHDIFHNPWKSLNVHTIGSLDKEDIDNHIIEVPGKCFVIAIPYCYERSIPEGFFQSVLDRVSERNTADIPVIMSAHTTISGCDFSGHDQTTENVIGGIESLNMEQMGEGYDYLALGHIHHAQFVHTGRHNVRYSGSPLAISFDEDYDHSVSLVEIDKHGETPKVTEIKVENPRPLVSIPEKGTATWEEAKRLLEKFPDDKPAYIRLNIRIENFIPAEANNDAAMIARNKACEFCYINAKRDLGTATEGCVLTIEEFKETNPIDIAIQYAKNQSKTLDDELTDMFNEVVRMVRNEDNI